MTPSPSLAAPLGRALRPDFGDDLTETGLAEAVKPILAVLRADPAVLQAVADALFDAMPDAFYKPRAEVAFAATILDALFGTLGAGPISSGEAAG